MEVSEVKADLEQAVFLIHEIKNPLAVIRANVQLIQLDSEERNKKCFDIIYSCIDKISELIQDNMVLIKNSSREIVESCEADVVASLIAIIEKYSALYERNFNFESFVEMAVVKCKKEFIESVFENIIKNAIEATKEGDAIDIKVKKGMRRAVITFSDTGCGIPDRDLERIAELFYTTKKGGSGVGLFMCKRIVEQSGGSFKIGHNKPKGIKVTVELNLL
ncbi:sporulation kinase D [Clostridiales bacterium]|nr:sporulation kinase D [Clostridiales bacterium]